jgi:site-specific recombinase XerD
LRTPKQKRLPQAYSDEAVRSLIAAIKVPLYRACFATMYACGLRIKEASSLPPTHILADKGVIRIIGKGDKERFVPLPPSLLDGLRKTWLLHHNPAWVFASRPTGSHVCQKTLYEAFNMAREEVGMPEATTHALRHSYATRLFEHDIRPEVVRILLGHASLRTTQLYLHLTEPVQARLRECLATVMRDLF